MAILMVGEVLRGLGHRCFGRKTRTAGAVIAKLQIRCILVAYMLNRLSVDNLAVVEHAEASFAPGLNVLTGETGAGKSVLMRALELALGGRADSSAVRDSAAAARVEAEFVRLPAAVDALLESAGLPPCEDGVLIVRRTVAANGTGRAWVNDAQTTTALLRRLGVLLADLHGPRANQRLLDEEFQRRALDAAGNVDTREYAAMWEEFRRRLRERDEILADEPSADEIDALSYQVNEFEEAAIGPDDEDLAARHAAAAHAEEIVRAANAITEALGGDGGAAEALSKIRPELSAAARYFPEAGEWAAQADAIAVQVEELSRTVADAASRLDADPDELQRLDERLSLVNRLLRKHRAGTVAELLQTMSAKQARLKNCAQREERRAAAEAALAAAAATVRKAGAVLTAARTRAAKSFSQTVSRELRNLGFLKARFTVRIEPAEPSASGCDRVTYMFEPNPGESARELAAIASSGETARVMLALKSVLALQDAADTLVFDEIDANVGGETGRAVGEKMRAVAQGRQVIAITHLPQCAAWGERHLTVAKAVEAGRTRTHVSAVDGEARVAEIARMLGGRANGVAGEHARELLAQAQHTGATAHRH